MDNLHLITGATGGLGKAFSAALARQGKDLVLTDVSPSLLETLAVGLRREFRVSVLTRACNLAREEGRDALFTWLEAAGLRFSGLINVAGMDREGEYAEQGLALARTMMQLNMMGAAECITRIIPLREKGRRLTVINVASLAAFQPMPYKALYAASKRFLVQLSLGIREELRPHDVAVSVLCPAGMPTTRSCIESMEAQGLLGLLTTMNAGAVADHALRQAAAGKAVIIPGGLNRLMHASSRLLPEALTCRLLAKKWRTALRSRCGSLNPAENTCGTPRLARGESLT
jgi:short-subunit dehydrogenase